MNSIQTRKENKIFHIVGTVRNVEHVLEQEFAQVNKIFGAFGEIYTYLVESDSEDKTSKVLSNMSASYNNFSYTSLGNIEKEISNRYARIAHCREIYLDYIRKLDIKIDYIVVVDLDGMNSKLNTDAVASCFKHKDWDAIFANQTGRYYDIGALRHQTWSPNDCFVVYNEMLKFTNEKNARLVAIQSRMITLEAKNVLIPVNSAYGGLGIYKKDAFVQGTYIGEDHNGNPLLDFVCFNEILTLKGYKLFINPQLINAKYNSHNAGSNLLYRFIRKTFKFLTVNRIKQPFKKLIIKIIS